MVDLTRAGLERRPAYWTCDESLGSPLYYFAPQSRSQSPYLVQRHVEAIIDIADDGTLAGVELVDGDLPPPPKGSPTIDAMPAAIEALEASVRAIDDWLCTYADTEVKPEQVEAAWKRILDGGGTIAYIAETQERNRAALAALKGADNAD